MRTLGRAVGVAGLLVGFYLLSAAIIVGLVVADVALLSLAGRSDPDPAYLKVLVVMLLVTVAAFLIIGRGVFVSTRVSHGQLPGVVVREADEPALWQRVRELARLVGTRPPSEIRLVGDVNAAVLEQAHLLGLLPGKRRMLIGVPLLLGLTPAQFDAVVAHELGHFSGSHTRIGPLVGRTRGGVLTALSAAAGQTGGRAGRWFPRSRAVFFLVFGWYARVVLAVTQPVSRDQELEADLVSARIAGRDNVAAALRELPVLHTAYGFYLDRYVAPGLTIGLLPHPPEVLGGFGGLLADPARHREMDEIRRRPPERKAHAHDTHPPLSRRIAAIEALPPDGRPPEDAAHRAIALLRDPARALGSTSAAMLGARAAENRAVDWDTLVTAATRERATRRAAPLVKALAQVTDARATLPAFLDAVDAGRLDEIRNRLPRPAPAGTADATSLEDCLTAWVLADLARRRLVRWRHTWADVNGEMRLDPAVGTGLDGALAAAVADRPDTAPLRAVLYPTGVPA